MTQVQIPYKKAVCGWVRLQPQHSMWESWRQEDFWGFSSCLHSSGSVEILSERNKVEDCHRTKPEYTCMYALYINTIYTHTVEVFILSFYWAAYI